MTLIEGNAAACGRIPHYRARMRTTGGPTGAARLEENPDGRVPLAQRLLRVLGVGIFAPTRSTPPQRRESADEVSVERRLRDRFDDFYRSHYAAVVRLAYSLCGSMQIAEELAQEAFVAAHRRWHRIVTFDRPDLWVRRVVINRSISYRRRLVSERKAIERISTRPAETPEPSLGDEAVWQALRELSPRQAEVLALVYVEDQPIAAVAEILGLGEETVRTHLKRGRAALAQKLDVERGARR